MSAAAKTPSREDTRAGRRALRLIFEYEGDHISLVSARRVAMMVPPSDPLAARRRESGFWFELKDGSGKTLYRRVTHDPIQRAVELRSDDPDRPFTREDVKNPAGTFVLLVPDLAEAREVALSSSPPGREALAPAKEIARFRIELGRRSED